MRLQTEISQWFGSPTTLPETGRVHFVGIGGAGMSALARILLARGYTVTGSDLFESAVTKDLVAKGASIGIGHRANQIEGADIVVISDAVDLAENPEAMHAKTLGIPVLRRSQLMGQLLRDKRVLAVTGSHGKSTATAMLAKVLEASGFDPLVIVGADVPGLDGNVRYGKGDWAVVEACEAYDSFHDIPATHVLLTNLEPEHLDFHQTWERLRDSVSGFIRSATGEPKLVYCGDDAGALEVADVVGGGVPYTAKDAVEDCTVLGRHNALNARGVVEMAKLVGISEEAALAAVKAAKGPSRRLEKVGEVAGVTIYDDYAHHPTEIRASLEALAEAYPKRRLVVVFQPHLYSRTRDQLEHFAPALSVAECVVITDIYPAREKPIPGVSAVRVVEDLERRRVPTIYVPSRHWLVEEVARLVKEGDVVVGMGAGNIEAFARGFARHLSKPRTAIRVAVLAGGDSVEREVSLLSGEQVAQALRKKGYEVMELDPTELLVGKGSTALFVGEAKPDIAFLALHGTGAEDGTIQGVLDTLRIPYCGAGVLASALGMDKQRTKTLLSAQGIQVPKGMVVPRGAEVPSFPTPCVVKPNRQGSTIGLTFVKRAEDLQAAVEKAWKYDTEAIVEELIHGVEISVPVLGDEVLPAVEIAPRSGMYDFTSKYTPGETEEIVPARISSEAAQTARDYARKAHQIIGAQDFSRTDMIVAGDEVVVLEVNTLPGLTGTSLLPKSAEAAGISYEELCDRIVRSALHRYGIKA